MRQLQFIGGFIKGFIRAFIKDFITGFTQRFISRDAAAKAALITGRAKTAAQVMITLVMTCQVGLSQAAASPDAATPTAAAGTINIAVAANFKATLQQLIDAYSEQLPLQSKPRLRIINGATGALFTQISQGAPFDLFFAADSLRPQQLVAQQRADKNSLAVYAIGQTALVLKADSAIADTSTIALCRRGISNNKQLRAILQHPSLTPPINIAIANPKTAPYGAVALALLKQTFENEQQYRLIRGKNVLHAQQLLMNGNVDFALLSVSQQHLPSRGAKPMGDHYCPLATSLAPAVQQSVVIIRQPNRNAIQRDTLQAFYRYILSPDARRIIARNGYLSDVSGAPDDSSAAINPINSNSDR